MKNNIPDIRGAGGGGKGGGGGQARTPVESPDSLHSRAYARVLDLLCEGEIEGLVNGAQSIYIDGTPLQNPDGSYNFSGVTVDTRNGTQGQSYIAGISGIESEISVGVECTNAIPAVRTISNANANAVRVTVGIPQLTSQNASTGDIGGTSVDIAIDVQSNGGGYVTKVADTISGKTTSRYQRSYNIQLSGSAPWDIRVRRITADNATSVLVNRTYWDGYTEIINAKLRYPNSALNLISIDAQQFRSIPRRGYDAKLMRVQVPSNYNSTTRTYSSSWDGTFQIAWTDNPAWCFYDLITNNRYGLGAFITAAQIDKWALYTIGKYCDEYVPNGFGSSEPRFTCNLYLQTRAEAFKVVQDMASIFRGMAFWSAGAITAIQDSPADPSLLYTASNVINGEFNYSGSSLKARHTVALVTWNDPDDLYRQKVEYVEDLAGIARYGVIQTEIVATGCTSRGQAHRIGKWLLYSETVETETVTFKTGIEAALARPGQIIQIQDPDRAGARLGGRIISATSITVTVDQTITLNSSQTYTLYAMLPDGSVSSKSVASVAGSVITVSSAYSTPPQANAVWILSSVNLSPQTFRVVNVIETADGIFEITGLKHDPNKYASVEQGLTLVANPISTLKDAPSSPQNIKITENLYQVGSDTKNLVLVDWDSSSGAAQYEVSWKRNDGNFTIMPATAHTNIEIRDAQPGLYSIKVVAISALGKRSIASPAEKQIYGKLRKPLDVQNFSLVAVGNKTAQLTWDQAAQVDLDVLVGGYVWLRFTPKITGQSWNDAIDIKYEAGNSTGTHLSLQTGTYLAKFVDSSGNTSSNAVMTVSTVSDLDGLNIISAQSEHPSFSGIRTNVAYDSSLGGLKLDSLLTIDQMTFNIDTWSRIDSIGGVASSGTYRFNLPDLGGVYPCKVSCSVTVQGYDTGDLIDSRTSNIDTWPSIDGSVIDDVGAALYIRTTNDDPAGSPTWTVWMPFLAAEFTMRAAQCELRLNSFSPTHNILATALTVQVDMPDRIEAGSNIVSGAGTYSAVFSNQFKATPQGIGITGNNLNSGDYWQITNKTATGFDIVFKDSSNNAVSRTFDYQAKGYGKKVA